MSRLYPWCDAAVTTGSHGYHSPFIIRVEAQPDRRAPHHGNLRQPSVRTQVSISQEMYLVHDQAALSGIAR